MIELHDSDGRSFWVRPDSIQGMTRRPSIYHDEVEYTLLYIWPCLVQIQETPEQILKLIEEK